MSGIDQRVVEMKFDKSDFSRGVQGTLNELAKLRDSLKLEGVSQGLTEATSGLQNLDRNTSGIASRFTALQAVAFGALASIGSKAVQVGEQLVSSLTVDPIKGGLEEYQTNLNSIQTILANTQVSGATLDDVNRALQDLNHYSDQTIYNFSEMARNIGTFTAAGVDLQTSTNAIKGIANLAALSGSSADQASQAMYQLSQEIASGKVTLQGWNSVVNAGMGGTTFQRALAQTAVAMGSLSSGALKLEGPMQNVTIAGKSFRESIDATSGTSWLTSDVLVKTLEQFTGDLTDAQLAAEGFNEQQIAAIQQTAKTAKLSATEVKTLSGVLDVAKETVGSGWAQTWQLVFGDFGEAKATFTDLSNTINGFLNASANARNGVLSDWKALGGRTALIEAAKNAFQALSSVITPIKDAFREIFPAKTGQDLYNMTVALRDFLANLKIGGTTANNLKRTFAGFFAVIDIGWQLLKAGIHFIAELIGHFTQGSGGVLKFTGNIGDFLTKLDAAIKKGDIFNKFFGKLATVIEKPIDAVKRFVGLMGQLLQAIFNADNVQGVIGRLQAGFKDLNDTGDKIASAWGRVVKVFKAVWDAVEPILAKIGNFIKDIGSGIADFLGNLSFGDVLGGVGVGLAGAVALSVKKFVDTLRAKFSGENAGPGIFDSVKESLDKLTGTLKQMQNMLKAATLLEIAAAIGILTIAVSVLSKIDAAGLSLATAAISAMLINLTGTMILMDKMMKKAKAVKLDLIAAGMILVAIAIDILASAVKKMADLSWNDLSKGLTGVVVLLGAVGGAMRLMPSQSKMISTGVGVLAIATAIKVLVSAAQDMADMSWGDIAKGLTGVAALLTSLALYTKFSNVSSIGDGAGLLLMAAAIKVLGSAMKDISDLSWEDIAKGLVGVAGGLIAMAGAMKLMPKKSVINGAALLEAAAAIKILASAMSDIGDMSWGDVGKSLAGIAGGLLAMALALKIMPPSSAISSLGLLAATFAIKILAGALKDMGSMSWSDIAAALVELAGALLIIGVALTAMDGALPGALALLAATPAFGALAKAMQTMGAMSWSDIAAALVALGGALLVLTIGLTAMIVALPGALALLVAIPGLEMLVLVMKQLGDMSWKDIGAAIGAMALFFGVLALGGALSPLILALGLALGVLAGAIAVVALAVKDVGTGVDSFADGLTKLSQIDPEGLNNISNAIQTVIDKLPALATAAADAISNFITEISNRTPEMAHAAGQAALAMAEEISNDMPQVVSAFMDGITDTLNAMADRAPDMANAGGDFIVNTLEGIGNNMSRIITAGADVITKFLDGVGQNSQKVIDAGFNLLIDFLNGLADSIEKNAPKVRAAAKRVGDAIIEGITGGVEDGKPSLLQKIGNMASGLLQRAKDILGVKSPSKEFEKVGTFVVEGFANGLAGNREKIEQAAGDMVGQLTDAMDAEVSEFQKHQDKYNDLLAQRRDVIQDLTAAALDLRDAQNIPIKPTKTSTRASQQTAKDNKIRDAQKRYNDIYEKLQATNQAIEEELAAARQNEDEYNHLVWARSVLLNQLSDEKVRLEDLADARDANNQAIDDEQKVLDDAIKTRDDYNQSLRDQYGAQEDINKSTVLSDYVSNLQEQIVATQQFTTAIQELRKRGLNDELYRSLLAKGPVEAMPFVQQLLEGGQEAVDDINNLGATLDEAAGVLGDSASSSLYQAGVDAAQGILNGLQSKASEIQAQMDAIAQYMVNALNEALGIRSPSRVFAQIGKYSIDGLVKGFKDATPAISDATEGAGKTVIDSMRKTISGLGDLISGEMDLNPVIAPVLDLSNIQRDASSIGSLLSTQPLQVEATYTTASVASTGYEANVAALAELMAVAAEPPPPSMTFIQNNTSPKALSAAELYRQTNNQISIAKGALTSNARSS